MQFVNRALTLAVAFVALGSPASSRAPRVGSVPLMLEDNRVFVELTFRRTDGTSRKARAWVDTGGGSLLLTERLANDLGLARTGPEESSDDRRSVPLSRPSVSLDALPLDVSSARVFAYVGTDQIAPGVDAEAFLPGRVLMHYHVVFDYPGHTFTMALPGVLTPRGKRVAATIHPESGFPRIELTIDGKPYGFLLDTGAAYTMISRELLEKWAAAHQDWPRLTGAVAEANMLDDQTDVDALLLRLPHLQWGSIEMRNVGAVSRRLGTFETYMTRMMSGPIIGAIAGNVLKTLRLEIDYPNGAAYIEKEREVDASDLDSVGIIFGIAGDGTYRITGVARRDGRDVVEGIRAGDQLISIDGSPVTSASRGRVIPSLQGSPGDRRRLRLRRAGKEFEVEVAIQHLL
jgi:predicted aspartyl protease